MFQHMAWDEQVDAREYHQDEGDHGPDAQEGVGDGVVYDAGDRSGVEA